MSNLDIFDGLSPETTTRLIYLITYMNYNGDLMKNHKTKMKKSDLCSILGLSDATIFRFWKEVNDKYIYEDSGGYLKLSSTDIFQKGKLKQNDDNSFYQRFYIDAIQNLYKKTDTSKHKHLGYVFKMLPFINIEYNVLCNNPFETDEKEIHPIGFNEFCEYINYENNQRKRLIKTYSEIKFKADGKRELFCSFVSDGINNDNQKIFVNPHILYGGSDYKKVKVLGIFCR